MRGQGRNNNRVARVVQTEIKRIQHSDDRLTQRKKDARYVEIGIARRQIGRAQPVGVTKGESLLARL